MSNRQQFNVNVEYPKLSINSNLRPNKNHVFDSSIADWAITKPPNKFQEQQISVIETMINKAKTSTTTTKKKLEVSRAKKSIRPGGLNRCSVRSNNENAAAQHMGHAATWMTPRRDKRVGWTTTSTTTHGRNNIILK